MTLTGPVEPAGSAVLIGSESVEPEPESLVCRVDENRRLASVTPASCRWSLSHDLRPERLTPTRSFIDYWFFK